MNSQYWDLDFATDFLSCLEPMLSAKGFARHLELIGTDFVRELVSRLLELLTGLEEEALPEKLSASWNATFEEGKANTRTEWRCMRVLISLSRDSWDAHSRASPKFQICVPSHV